MITEDSIFKVIGKNVKYYRLLYSLNNGKMTQKDLARKVGVETSVIGNIERDNPQRGIKIYTLYKISEALDVSIDKFFEIR